MPGCISPAQCLLYGIMRVRDTIGEATVLYSVSYALCIVRTLSAVTLSWFAIAMSDVIAGKKLGYERCWGYLSFYYFSPANWDRWALVYNYFHIEWNQASQCKDLVSTLKCYSSVLY